MISTPKRQDISKQPQSYIRSVINSATKNALGKTLPSQSMNLDFIGIHLPLNERAFTNRTSMSANEEGKLPFIG